MKSLIFLIAPILIFFGGMNSEIEHQKETVYYLIRHAEKDRTTADKDPELNEEGKLRAEKWAEVFKEVKFDAVYSTNYKRTLATATPTTKLSNVKIVLYDANKLFTSEFQKQTEGKTVLVVGHSNTTPAFANAILNNKKYEDVDDAENGALFIVTLHADGSKSSQVLYIN